MPPTRSQWAVGIAEHFFKQGQGDDQVLLHASDQDIKEIGRSIGVVTNVDPIDDLAAAVIKHSNIFSPYPELEWPDPGHRLPEGIADLALAINVAERYFSGKDEFTEALRKRLAIPLRTKNDPYEPPFHSGRPMGGNLKKLIPKLIHWSQLNGGRGSFQSTLDWGAWRYISKFYEQLGPTSGDKKLLKEISTQLIEEEISELGGGNPYDLADDTKRISTRLLLKKEGFDPRLKEWISGGYGNSHHSMVVHLCSMSINRLVNKDLESIINPEERDAQRDKKPPKMQPRIYIEEAGHGRNIEWSSRLFLETFSGESQEDTEEKVDDEVWKFLSEHAQHKGVNFRNILPIAILVEEDGEWQLPRFTEESNQRRIGPGEQFAILSVGHIDDDGRNSADEMMEDLATRLSSNHIPRINEKVPFGNGDMEISLVYGLKRNFNPLKLGDPQALGFRHSVKLVHGIRHQGNSNVFHPWGGPELRVSTGPQEQLDGTSEKDPPHTSIGLVKFTQKMKDRKNDPLNPVIREVYLSALKADRINHHSLDSEASPWYLDSKRPPEIDYAVANGYEDEARENEADRRNFFSEQRRILEENEAMPDTAKRLMLEGLPEDDSKVRHLHRKIKRAGYGEFYSLLEIVDIDKLDSTYPDMHYLAKGQLILLTRDGGHNLIDTFELAIRDIRKISPLVLSDTISKLSDDKFQDDIHTMLQRAQEFRLLGKETVTVLSDRLSQCDSPNLHLQHGLGLISDSQYQVALDSKLKETGLDVKEARQIVQILRTLPPKGHLPLPITSGKDNYFEAYDHIMGLAAHPPGKLDLDFLKYPSLRKLMLDAVTTLGERGGKPPSTDFLVKIDEALSNNYSGYQKRKIKIAITKPIVESTISKIREAIDPDVNLDSFMDRDSDDMIKSNFFGCEDCNMNGYSLEIRKYVVAGPKSATYYKRDFKSFSTDRKTMEEMLKQCPELTFTQLERLDGYIHGVLTCEHSAPTIFSQDCRDDADTGGVE